MLIFFLIFLILALWLVSLLLHNFFVMQLALPEWGFYIIVVFSFVIAIVETIAIQKEKKKNLKKGKECED